MLQAIASRSQCERNERISEPAIGGDSLKLATQWQRYGNMMIINKTFLYTKELYSGHVEFSKGAISHLRKSLFLVVFTGIVPSVAYAHSGVEPFMPYIMLLGLLVGMFFFTKGNVLIHLIIPALQ